MKHLSSVRIIVASIGLLSLVGSVSAREISVMQYNMENLFDTQVDADHKDDEFTPDGSKHWTPEKLHLKLQQLGKVLKSVHNADGSICPDLISMVEVENANVLKQFKEEALQECKYTTTVIDPRDPDPRGIKVSLMTRLQLAGQPISHPTYKMGRFIQETSVTVNGHTLTVFVNHWKSKLVRPPETGDGEEKRVLAAKILQKRMTELFQQNPDVDMLAMGDFNDGFESQSISQVLGGVNNPNDVINSTDQLKLWETSFDLLNEEPLKSMDPDQAKAAFPIARHTYYYARAKSYDDIDHILISKGLLDEEGFSYKPQSFEVVKLPFTTNPKTHGPIPFTPIADENGDYTKAIGASDHFPVLIRLNVQE